MGRPSFSEDGVGCLIRRTNRGEQTSSQGSRRRRQPGSAELGRLLGELDRPLEPEFVLHAYALLANRIMRRTWQGMPDSDAD